MNTNFIAEWWNNILNTLMLYMGIISLMAVVFCIAAYAVRCYSVLCMGRKAGLKSEWMPFIPVCCSIYQMKIVKAPIWFILFKKGTLLNGILSLIVWLITRSIWGSFGFYIVTLVFTFLYYQKFYEKFGFNRFAAWLHVVPVFSMIGVVFEMFVAFYDAVYYHNAAEQEENFQHEETGQQV